jgi:hypothetical protein
MRRTQHRRRTALRGRPGQGLVEFALIIPVALMIVFGIFEFGRLYMTKVSLRHTVQEAARFAVTGNVLPDTTGAPLTRTASIQEMIIRGAPHLHIDPANIYLNPPNGGGPGALVQVGVEYDFRFLFPLLGNTGTLRLQSSSTMKNEPF